LRLGADIEFEEEMARTRILIADDHVLVAETFRSFLEPQYQVVGVVTNGKSLLTAAKKTAPDIVLLDLAMPLFNGIDAGEELKRQLPKVKIIVITMNEDPEVASTVLRHWASSYLLKKSASIELTQAISEVLHGHSYVTPSMAQKVMFEFIRDPNKSRSKQLTPRQREVLQLLAEGHSMKEAAGVLNIAVRTIAFHKYRIMEDFGLKNNADLVRLAIREHLISET
jgi:DNA-binding NarL/FixJ family response regulator